MTLLERTLDTYEQHVKNEGSARDLVIFFDLKKWLVEYDHVISGGKATDENEELRQKLGELAIKNDRLKRYLTYSIIVSVIGFYILLASAHA
jgi:hypothetical protein